MSRSSRPIYCSRGPRRASTTSRSCASCSSTWTSLDLLAETLARAVRPGGRIRIVDLHPERVAAGSLAHFQDGHTEIRFASVAHPVTSICDTFALAGFDVVRRDWLASDPMISAVPGIGKHRGLEAVLDIKAIRCGRLARGSRASY